MTDVHTLPGPKPSDGSSGDPGDPFWLVHTYRTYHPRPGDVALCGWVKRSWLHKEDVPSHQRMRCVVCGEMTGRWAA